MSAAPKPSTVPAATPVGAGTSPSTRRGRSIGNTHRQASTAARRQAALILEVLAGSRSPAIAASALGVPPVRYYQLEARAVDGLVAACEPRIRGRQPREPGAVTDSERVQRLESECRRLTGELARLQALLRLNRLTLGVAPPPPPAAKPAGGGRKPRRATVRALRHARATAPPPSAATVPVPTATAVGNGVMAAGPSGGSCAVEKS